MHGVSILTSKLGAWALALTTALMFGACKPPLVTAFEQNREARHALAALQVAFARAVEAGGRAVLSDGEGGAAASGEVMELREQVKKSADALGAALKDPSFSEEQKLVAEFRAKFAAYEVLDREILALANEKTNVRARALSFGAVQAQADAFAEALRALVRPKLALDAERERALSAEAIAAVRELQTLEAPHIAEADDAAMTALEERMARSETVARDALLELAKAHADGAPDVAKAALEQFLRLHAEVLALSRRNTNVQSRAMTLTQKRALAAICEDSLQALSEALVKRSSPATR
jgi:hypothetical protein